MEAPETEVNLAEITRFGPQEEAKTSTLSPEEINRKTQTALTRNDFDIDPRSVNNNYPDWPWISFATSFGPQPKSSSVEKAEHQAITQGEEIPEWLLDTYKICIDIDPQRIPDLVNIIGTQFHDIPLFGKIAKPPIYSRDNFPKMVLYFEDTDLNEVLDLSITLGKAIKRQIGPSDSILTRAMEVESRSGVFLTQGTYSTKEEALKLGKVEEYYTKGGVFYKKAAEKYPPELYLIRRHNQFVIEESLYNYVGHNKVSELLMDIQIDAFRMTPPNLQL